MDWREYNWVLTNCAVVRCTVCVLISGEWLSASSACDCFSVSVWWHFACIACCSRLQVTLVEFVLSFEFLRLHSFLLRWGQQLSCVRHKCPRGIWMIIVNIVWIRLFASSSLTWRLWFLMLTRGWLLFPRFPLRRCWHLQAFNFDSLLLFILLHSFLWLFLLFLLYLSPLIFLLFANWSLWILRFRLLRWRFWFLWWFRFLWRSWLLRWRFLWGLFLIFQLSNLLSMLLLMLIWFLGLTCPFALSIFGLIFFFRSIMYNFVSIFLHFGGMYFWNLRRG